MTIRVRVLSVLFSGVSLGLFCPGLASVESASAQDAASAASTAPDEPVDIAEPPAASELIDESQLDVLTRGPVHEAFAEQINRDPSPGIVVEKAPPEAVREVPPEYKPDGDNVSWIPGYWAWDEDRTDYIWVSGVWRNAPPQRAWVPGYWYQTSTGYQWVSGYWSAGANEQAADDVEYLDPPPESLEQGPSYDAPSDDHFWTPGCWTYSATGYNWRPGYWQSYRPNWIWVPDRYSWTPAGCVYVNGYWDYRLPYRGQLFAPVYFNNPLVYRRPHYYYRPGFVIDAGRLHLHLFTYPRYRHYFFGDYHGSSYLGRGYYPHFSFHLGGYGYDPLFTYYNHDYRRRGIDYGQRLHGWHRYYASHRNLRPPHSYGAQREFERRHRGHQHLNQAVLARQLSDEVRSPRHNRRFVQMADDQQRVQRERTQEIRASQARRAASEARQRSRARARQLSSTTPSGPESSIRDGASSVRDRTNGRGPRGTEGRVTTNREPGNRQPGNRQPGNRQPGSRVTAQGDRPAGRERAPNAVASPGRDPRYSSGGSRNYKRSLDLARQRQQAAANQSSNLRQPTTPSPRASAPSASRSRQSARTMDRNRSRDRSQAIRSFTGPSTSAGGNSVSRQSVAKPPVASSRSRSVAPRSRPQATSRPSVSPRRGTIPNSRSPSRQNFSPSSQRAQRTLQSNRNLSSGTQRLLQTQSRQPYMDRRKAYSTMRRSQPSARSSRPAASARSSSSRASSARASASRARASASRARSSSSRGRASASRSRGGGGKGKK